MFNENLANIVAVVFLGIGLVTSIYNNASELSYAIAGGLMGFLGVSSMNKKG